MYELLMLISLTIASAVNYGPCNPSKYPWAGIKVSVPIVQEYNTIVKVAGNLVIRDGCNFAAENFTLTNAELAYWYGYSHKWGNNSMRLSTDYVLMYQYPVSLNYSLTQTDVGAKANFDQVEEIRLFAPNLNVLIAKAILPPHNYDSKTEGRKGKNGSTKGSKLFPLVFTLLILSF